MSATPLHSRRTTRRIVLASASPARLATLHAAGLDPEVVVSHVDETAVTEQDAAKLCLQLARLKAQTVAGWIAGRAYVVGCDSVLELNGTAYGRPADTAQAAARWREMRGSHGVLHTGHCIVETGPGDVGAVRSVEAVASTVVHFADLDDEEIAAYVATGEPLRVAGAFTIDGLGGPFVERIEGDPHAVVGISLPLLRRLLAELGVPWPALWAGQGT